MHEITYHKDILDIIYKFTSTMNKEVLFVKEGENVVIRQRTEVGIYHVFTTKLENFNFAGDELAFYDFVNFYEFLEMLKSPQLFQAENKIVLQQGSTKINYLISDRDAIAKSQFTKNAVFGDSSVGFTFDEKDLNNIRNLIKKMNIDNVRFTFKDNKCNLTLFKAGYDNSSEIVIDLPVPFEGPLELEIKSYLFKNEPVLPYALTIYSDKQPEKLKFSYANDLYSLDVITSVRNDQ